MTRTRSGGTRAAVIAAMFLVVTGSWLFRGGLAPAAPRLASAAAHVKSPATAVVDSEPALPRVQGLLRAAPAPPPRSDRDPFRFGAAEAPLPSRASTRGLLRLNVPPSSSLEDPHFVLFGVAEDLGSGLPRRTAVVGGAHELTWFVQAGDMLTEQYRVEHVGAEFAMLIDVRTHRTRQLVLR